MSAPIFQRPDLALALSNRLLHPDALQLTSRDGLFLTGVRRIGKTTFIRRDLIPQLEKENALVIYIDLWENRGSISPAEAVLSKIRQFLAESPRLSSFKVTFPGVSLSFEPKQVGIPSGVSLANVFSEIVAKYDVNIVLIIDEIQEALKNEAGLNLLTALKAARDAVNLRANNPKDTYLLIVGTGSHRSILTAMAARSSQPFYGTDRQDFPLLGDEYLQWQVDQMKDKSKVPSREALREGFSILGCRPKAFRQLLTHIQSYPGVEINQSFVSLCTNQARIDANEFLDPIRNCDLITRLLFTEIAKAGLGGCTNLFSSAFRAQLTKSAGLDRTISASSIQGKLGTMQKNDWIYPVSYGCYAASDPQAASIWLSEEESD
mgnify:FL=1